jgi:YggT family protein
MQNKLILLLVQAIEIYSYMLLAWVIFSWFPRVTSSKFYQYLDQLIYPYAKIFRGLIPPIGGFDFSVIVAFLVLSIVQRMIASLMIVGI